MVMPSSPNAMDNLFQNYGNAVFSQNPEQEKKLATYFMWLRDNFNTLSKSQKNDYNVLKVKQNFAVLKKKDASQLTAEERDFLRKYGVNAFGGGNNSMDRFMEQMSETSANVNFVTSKDELPRPQVSSQGTTGLLTKVGKESGFKSGQDVYKYQDYSTGETSYYYVVKDIQRYDSASTTFSNPLARYQKLAEIVRNDPTTTSNNINGFQFNGTTGTQGKTTPAKYVKVWYSADYKRLYDGEIQKQVLELLNIPDMVLANYDWETIDSLQDSSGSTFYEDNEIIYEQYFEPETKIQSSISPQAANLVYKIQDNLVPIHVSLNNYRSEDSTVLSNFGFHKSARAEITPLFPSYTSNGQPRYDLELEFVDAEEVLGYTVYLVEEDGII
jgi:hypothetical protein